MKRSLWLFALMILFMPGIAQAQTDTPTPTPTPTATLEPETRTLIPVGSVIAWSGNYTPDGWLVADGSCVAQESYPELYEVIGDIYDQEGCPGGAPICIPEVYNPGCGVDDFALPDLRGRVIVGAGDATDFTSVRAPGDNFGEENHLLTIDEMPSHNHTLSPGTSYIRAGTSGLYGPGSGASLTNPAIGLTGGSQPHNIMQPSLVLNYIIWTGTVNLSLGGQEIVYPTLAPTWTPEPLVAVYSTVDVGGTPQNVAFEYSVTAGDVAIVLIMTITSALLIIQISLGVLRGKH